VIRTSRWWLDIKRVEQETPRNGLSERLSSCRLSWNVLQVAISHGPYRTRTRILTITQDCAALVLG